MVRERIGLGEEWVTFESLPNYAVSNLGNVANLKRNTLLTPSPDANGYFKVALYHKGVRRDVYIHRLVARAFLFDYDEGREVNHIDRDKSNCSVENLKMGQACRSGDYLW